MRIERALLSVSNKDGLVDFAQGLEDIGVEIISTGGTAALLERNGIKTIGISEVTGWPEMLDGRVKTLHPMIHAGILARRDSKEHMAQLANSKVKKIDMVVVNLYPFKETVLKGGSLDEIIENIDIGGPSLIRAAAKNHEGVAVVTNPARYPQLLEELRATGQIGEGTLKTLALEAFRSTAIYDAMVSSYLAKLFPDELFPSSYALGMEKAYDLRYGENPQQTAAFYIDPFSSGVSVGRSEKLHGKEISYNNILDLESALELLREFPDRPTVVVIKHTNPCGLASHSDLSEAYRRALTGDPVSAFGGIVASNRTVNMDAAKEINKTHFDAIIAPDYEKDALALLKKKSDMRILKASGAGGKSASLEIRKVSGSCFFAMTEFYTADKVPMRTMSKREPTDKEIKDLLFAWRAVKHIKSNAIVLVKDFEVGILNTDGIADYFENRFGFALFDLCRFERFLE